MIVKCVRIQAAHTHTHTQAHTRAWSQGLPTFRELCLGEREEGGVSKFGSSDRTRPERKNTQNTRISQTFPSKVRVCCNNAISLSLSLHPPPPFLCESHVIVFFFFFTSSPQREGGKERGWKWERSATTASAQGRQNGLSPVP